jgi:hypothetical protein
MLATVVEDTYGAPVREVRASWCPRLDRPPMPSIAARIVMSMRQ